MGFAQWLDDRRWAANMRRARAWRRGLPLAQRTIFDESLRPHLKPGSQTLLDYPDAVYYVTIDDLMRAMSNSCLARYLTRGSLPNNGPV